MFAALLIVGLLPQHAQAWGDQGHRIIALIADRYLDPVARTQLGAMLGGDTDSLTPHDIASESMWADKYRDSDRSGIGERYRRTRQWHFVDIELDSPNLDQACHTIRDCHPGFWHHTARRMLASLIRSTNSRPSLPTPKPLPKSGLPAGTDGSWTLRRRKADSKPRSPQVVGAASSR